MAINNYRLYLSLIGILSICHWSYAQNHHVKKADIVYKSDFTTYSSYPITCLKNMYKDSKGKIWLTDCSTTSTNTTGLYVFDGYSFQFRTFTKPGNKEDYNVYSGFKDDKVYGFRHTAQGNMLFYFDLISEKAIYYDTISPSISNLYFENNLKLRNGQTIIEDTIYHYNITSSLAHVRSYNQEGDLLDYRSIDYRSTLEFKHPKFKDFYELKYYKDWLINVDRIHKKIHFLNTKTKVHKIIDLSDYKEIHDDTNYHVMITTGQRMTMNIRSGNNFIYFDIVFKNNDILLKKTAERQSKLAEPSTTFFEDASGNMIFVDTDNNQIYSELWTNTDEKYDVTALFKSVSNNSIAEIKIIGDNFMDAIFILDVREFSIQKIETESKIDAFIENNPVRSIVQLDDEHIGYMYKYTSGGVFKLRIKHIKDSTAVTPKDICEFYRMDLVKHKTSIWGLVSDFSNDFTIGKYNTRSKTCITFDLGIPIKTFFVIDDNRLVVVDKKNKFWYYNTTSRRLSPLLNKGQAFRLQSEFFYFLKDKSKLWIAGSMGLYSYDMDVQSLRNIGDDIKNFDFTLTALTRLDAHRLLLGTLNHGLIVLDTRNMTYCSLSVIEGLPHPTVASITVDHNNYVWVATYNGVALFDPDLSHLQNVFESDGLVHNEANRKSSAVLNNGKIAIGTLKGLSVIDPAGIIQDIRKKYNFHIYFNALTYYDADTNKERVLTSILDKKTDIIMHPANNKLDIMFYTSELVNSSEISFFYKIKGLSDQWIDLGSKPQLTLFGLAAGDYGIQIKAKDKNGKFTVNTLELNVIVEDFFYNKIWFYTLMVALVMITVGLWIFTLRNRIKHATHKIETDKITIEQQAQELKSLDQVKTSFFTNITHEFRTPLTIITSVTELLSRNKKLKLDKELQVIQDNTNDILTKVNQILDLRKLDSDKMTLQPIRSDVLNYIDYIIDNHKYLAEQSNIHLEFKKEQAHFNMDFDPDKLQSVLNNLLTNAIKNTKESGKIQVEVQISEDEHLLIISIKDNGVGMSPNELNHAFEHFYQSHNGLNASKGSGLGLTLTNKLVQLMNGSISIESEENIGTFILLKLPITQYAKAGDPLQRPNRQSYGSGIHVYKAPVHQLDASSEVEILIIEDNDSIRHILQTQLKSYIVLTAHNGQEGIDIAKQQLPDLIISDIMMPSKDGYQVCIELKQDLVTSHIPIILLTAKADHESKIDGLTAKADAYIKKPYHLDELELTIQNLLESRKLLHKQFQTLQKGAKPTLLPDEDRFILKLREIIENHIDDKDFRAEELCTVLMISRAQLYRKLKSLTGLSVSKYITLIRLQEAKKLLVSTEMTISEIAYQVGISSQSYFSTKFKEEFGMSPSEYRQNLMV